jgi:excisionase family DNA binding protein
MSDHDLALRTIEFAQDFLGLSRRSIYRLVANDKLELVKLGQSARITQHSLNIYVSDLRETAAARRRLLRTRLHALGGQPGE